MKKLLLSLTLFASIFAPNASSVTDAYGNKLYMKSNHKNDYLPSFVNTLGSKMWECTYKCTHNLICNIGPTVYKNTITDPTESISNVTSKTKNTIIAIRNGNIGTALSQGLTLAFTIAGAYTTISYAVKIGRGVLNIVIRSNSTTSTNNALSSLAMQSVGLPLPVLIAYDVVNNVVNSLNKNPIKEINIVQQNATTNKFSMITLREEAIDKLNNFLPLCSLKNTANTQK